MRIAFPGQLHQVPGHNDVVKAKGGSPFPAYLYDGHGPHEGTPNHRIFVDVGQMLVASVNYCFADCFDVIISGVEVAGRRPAVDDLLDGVQAVLLVMLANVFIKFEVQTSNFIL